MTTPPIEIYTEMTPNPGSQKFVCNRKLIPQNQADFRSTEEAEHSPLASRLFKLPFVEGVFIAANFVTVTKAEKYEWFEISPEIKEEMKQFLLSGEPVLAASFFEGKEEQKPTEDQDYGEGIEGQIKMYLDKYVKPAVEQDGGHIGFKSYDDGVVTLSMQGACSGCPSSMITLKAGIEGLLKRMIPEIKEVQAEAE